MGRCGDWEELGKHSSFHLLSCNSQARDGPLSRVPRAWPTAATKTDMRMRANTHMHTHTCAHTHTHPTSHSVLVLRTQACVNSVRRSAQQELGGILEAGPLGVLLRLPPLHSDHNIRKSGKKLKQRSIRSPGILSSVPGWSCCPVGMSHAPRRPSGSWALWLL